MGGRKSSKIIFLFIVLLGTLLIWKTNDYKEKRLSDVINYDTTKFEHFAFEYRGDENDSWISDDNETFEELLNFLSKYEVKKVKSTDVDVKNREEGFDIFISLKGKADSDMYTIWEGYISKGGSDHYELLNGSIDMEWIKAYNKKNQSTK